ncbi:MAG: DUF2207 domain-containing protein, partial [Candidatus Aminicenantes bacterium]|nr:DUF2207 domain-containing protein [Candidatus Aminicenantes bacterium]
MRRDSRLRQISWVFAACVFLLTLNTIGEAQTKDFYFPRVTIEVNVDRDGSFTVDEYRTYDFQGSFSWALLRIPLRVSRFGYSYDVSIEDFKVQDERGTPLRMETSRRGGEFEAKWYYQASDQLRTFHIHYRLRGGIVSYPEVSELYWRVIGSGWDKPTEYAGVTVNLPQPVSSLNDILVYGHGPLSGRAEIVDLKTARFVATNLRAGQFMEVRMVWPAGMVS